MGTWLRWRANLAPFQEAELLSRALNENGTESSQRPELQRRSWSDAQAATIVTGTLPKAANIQFSPLALQVIQSSVSLTHTQAQM